MTALAGVWRRDGGDGAALACRRMLGAQSAFARARPVVVEADDLALGLALFPTLPQDDPAAGPEALEGGGWLVADVRIDNREEVEADLGLGPAGRRARDAALMARAWERWGEGLLTRVEGDFALALWDGRARRLWLARDAFGRRPLHVKLERGCVAFASMPVGLIAARDAPLELDEAHLAAFLALEPEAGPGSVFAGIERVEPGETLIVETGGARRARWYAPRRAEVRLEDPQAQAEALRGHLDRAVAARLRGAGAGVGAHLSSGWDSAAVAVTAARLMAPDGGRVTAFTAAPAADWAAGDPDAWRHADESVMAARVAAGEANIDHVVVRGEGRSPLDALDRDGALLGRPVPNPCNQVWIDAINAAARARGVRVLLSGDFGNFALTDSGDDWLGDLAARGLWLTWLRTALAALRAKSLTPAGLAAMTFGGRRGSFVRAVRWLKGDPVPAPGAHLALAPAHRRRPSPPRPSAFERRLGAATHVDRGPLHKLALGAYGVDWRDPLTDRRLVEFCLNSPREWVFEAGRPRALARRALADRLPACVLDLKTRGYQGADWHLGLEAARGELGQELDRLAATPLASRLIDLPRLRRLVRDWPDGGWSRPRVVAEYRLALLRAVSVGRFIRTSLGRNA